MLQNRDKSADWQSRFVMEIPAAVALFDRDLRYQAASAPWIAAFGLSRVLLAGRRHDELCRGGRAALAAVQQHVLAGESVEDYQVIEEDPAKRSLVILNARAHRDLDGIIAGVIVSLRQVHATGVAPGVLPVPDPLTGLAERHEFAQHLRELLTDPEPHRRDAVVIAINLDDFRDINTLHGSAIGDQFLRVTAERLVRGTRSRRPGENSVPGRGTDVVARLGADEFGIICGPPAPPLTEVAAIATRLLHLVQNPIAVGGRSLRLTASVGFIMTSPAHQHEDELLRDLDLALQQAKACGPSNVTTWQPSLTAAATHRCSLADQLRRAFDNGEFLLHYQPVVRLGDNRMVGAEALLRWNNPSEGLIASDAFVPALQETGLIVEVGGWAVREAVRQVETWHVLYGRDIIDWVGVNLSAQQLNDPPRLLATLRAIDDGGFSLHRLMLAVTETVGIRNPETAGAALAELHEMGLHLAIGDFATGCFSLDHLRRFPIDTLKIAGGFTARIGTADGDKLFRALLSIADIHGAAVIAEGVETAAQRDFLRQCGCGFGQGYLYAEPMEGALLGAYALTHAVSHQPEAAATRLAG
jgi:diguanylate cyclase (GGDEF)-like protein